MSTGTVAGPENSRSVRTADTFARHFLLPSEAVTRRYYTLLPAGGGQTKPASIIALQTTSAFLSRP